MYKFETRVLLAHFVGSSSIEPPFHNTFKHEVAIKGALTLTISVYHFHIAMHFQRVSLVCSKQGKLFENATQCGKCICKWDVATRLYRFCTWRRKLSSENVIEHPLTLFQLFEIDFPVSISGQSHYCYLLVGLVNGVVVVVSLPVVLRRVPPGEN